MVKKKEKTAYSFENPLLGIQTISGNLIAVAMKCAQETDGEPQVECCWQDFMGLINPRETFTDAIKSKSPQDALLEVIQTLLNTLGDMRTTGRYPEPPGTAEKTRELERAKRILDARKARKDKKALETRVVGFLLDMKNKGTARRPSEANIKVAYHGFVAWLRNGFGEQSKHSNTPRTHRFEGYDLVIAYQDNNGEGFELPAKRGKRHNVFHDFILVVTYRGQPLTITPNTIKKVIKARLLLRRSCML